MGNEGEKGAVHFAGMETDGEKLESQTGNKKTKSRIVKIKQSTVVKESR